MTLLATLDATTPSAEQEVLDRESTDLMRRALTALRQREAYVITLRLGLGDTEAPMTYAGIGAVLGVSAARVRQIYFKGIKNLQLAARGSVHNVALRRAVCEFAAIAA